MHSTLVKPMQDMIDHSAPKRSAVVWTPESTNSFHDTQIAISRCPLMYFIDDDKLDIRLYTDASDFGIGGVLFQVVDTVRQPIAFIDANTNKVVNHTERIICYILLLYTTRLSNQRSYVHNLHGSFEYYVYCGRTGYTGPTGRTGPCHDPPDPSAYSTHTALPRLAS